MVHMHLPGRGSALPLNLAERGWSSRLQPAFSTTGASRALRRRIFMHLIDQLDHGAMRAVTVRMPRGRGLTCHPPPPCSGRQAALTRNKGSTVAPPLLSGPSTCPRKAYMNVVIVESVAKAKAINKYLGSNYKVLASYGHVRDLPSKDGSVEPDNDFHMHWDVDGRSAKVMKEIAAAVKDGRQADPGHRPRPRGRGHLLAHPAHPGGEEGAQEGHAGRAGDLQRGHQAVRSRCVQGAARRSMRRWWRPISPAGRSTISSASRSRPVLWRKLPGARSAGRVQSVALRLVCDREAEIEAFKTEEYWTIEALLATAKGEEFAARLIGHRRQEARQARHQGRRHAPTPSRPPSRAAPSGRLGREEGGAAQPLRRPSPPRRCSRRPRASSASPPSRPCRSPSASTRASSSAARRPASSPTCEPTASPSSPRPIAAIRKLVERDYSKRYVPPFIREYKAKAKNAQEAHEAIRPTDVTRKPDEVAALRRARPGAALRADLEARRGEPDGLRRAGADHRRDRGARAATARPTGCAPPARSCCSTASSRLYEEGRDDRVPARRARPISRGRRQPPPAAARRRAIALKDRRHRGQAALHRAAAALSPRRRWSSAWRSWASAGPRPTPPRWPCCRSATTSASTRSG